MFFTVLLQHCSRACSVRHSLHESLSTGIKWDYTRLPDRLGLGVFLKTVVRKTKHDKYDVKDPRRPDSDFVMKDKGFVKY